MAGKVYNDLILCTGNSARSIIAECILNRSRDGRLTGYSAGSEPKGKVHPAALALLRAENYLVDDLRSKSWREFAEPDVPQVDFIFTVCDNAANETCPIWPGHPITAHWGIPDPAAIAGDETTVRDAFAVIMRSLTERIDAFIHLPFESMDRKALRDRLTEIGTR